MVKCECSNKKSFSHWWKYTKLRYYWRLFWAKLRYVKYILPDGGVCWVDNNNPWELRVYNQFPGPNMTKDEYDHWFNSRK